MLKLKRSFLLLLVLFLAACGTQTQVPEAALDNSTNIEVLKSGGKVNVHYKKYVVGHAPKGAKYKIELICKTNDKHQKVVLKQTVNIHKYKGYAFGKAYYGVGGYRCVVREIGNEHKGYYVGDHVVIQVKQKGKLIGYAAKHTSSRFDTVKTPSFKVGKHGTVHVYVTNKFKKADKKTDITIIKKFFDGKDYVKVEGEAKIFLVCKVGGVYKVVANFAASEYTEFKTEQYAGLSCYLKESFHSDSYTLEDVQISLESGKWGDDLDTNWKVKPGYVVSEHFTIPKSSLKIIIINVVREKEEEKKGFELVIKKDFDSDYKTGDPDYGNVVVELICDGSEIAELTLGNNQEKMLKLYNDYKDCVLKETYENEHYTLKHVSFNGKSGTVVGNVATSSTFELKLEAAKDGRITIIIVNGVEKKEKEPTPTKLELEIIKTFNLDVDLGVKVDLDFLELLIGAVDLRLVCDGVRPIVIDLEVGTVADLEARAELILDKGYENCDIEESFDADIGKLLSVSARLGEFSTIPVAEAISNKALLDLNLDLVEIDGRLVIIITNNIELKKPEPENLELDIVKQFRLNGRFISVEAGTRVQFLLFCDDRLVDQFTLEADSEQSELSTTVTLDGDTASCFFRETFSDRNFDLDSVSFNGASSVRPSGNGNSVDSAPFDPRLVNGDFVIINDVLPKRGGGGNPGTPPGGGNPGGGRS